MNENRNDTNAVSIYGQEGLEDFPVLKAFQQYIDAEQSKSRKRMIMLCVFFGFLMTIMIVVFLFMLRDVSARNQSLNDKLVEYVMKDRDRQPVVVQPTVSAQNNTANDAAIKAMTDTLAALQKQMADQQAKMMEQQVKFEESRAKMAEERIKAATAQKAAGPSREQLAIQRQIDEDTAKLVKARALLKAEKEKIEAEKERLRREEVERQRRRLYPEYYEKKASEEKAVTEKKQEPQAKPLSYFDAYDDDFDDDDDLDEIITTPAKPKGKPAAKPQPKPAAPKPTASVEAKSATGDRYVVPVEINGANSDWLIPTT
jgi:murein DD-endopeptidase MepM/ murein hydrolase activator NlpD